MTNPEAGIWGATSPKLRTAHGAPSHATHARTPGSAAGTPPRPRSPSAAQRLMTQLGIRNRDVKRWAYDNDLTPTRRGSASLAQVEAWAAAHLSPR